ncbi:MAG: family 78 glycoside hydrolase catalytic domain [Planctomycetaceae bacterium]|jgi:alpha-L-rhamnosidase|nr:family 78 glycoside hydrolase catalytic domain [Planctomycetaceae bacterium]
MYKKITILFAFSMLSVIFAAQHFTSAQSYAGNNNITPYDLRLEFLENPKGIDELIPRFSWKLKSDANNQTQSAYQIRLFEIQRYLGEPKNLPDGNKGKEVKIWDSKKIAQNITLVEFDGRSLLKPKTEYIWKLTVWDKKNKPSTTVAANFTTGVWNYFTKELSTNVGGYFAGQPIADANSPSFYNLAANWIGLDAIAFDTPEIENLQKQFQNATWIWTNKNFNNAPVGKAIFRRTFNLPETYKSSQPSAKFTLTADNAFTVYINDKKIGTGNNFNKIYTFDVSAFLKQGKNVFAIEVVNEGNSPNPAGLIGFLRIQNGADEYTFVTNTDWKVIDNPPAKSETAGFDDSTWKNATSIANFGAAPWGKPGSESFASPPARYLTKTFYSYTEKNKRKPVRATAYISGLGYYELYLNNKKIGDHVLDPILTDYDKHVPYVTYEIDPKELDNNNEHKLQVILGNGRYYAPRIKQPASTKTYGFPKLLFQLEILYSDGSGQHIYSDQSWKISTNGRIRDNNDYDGEIFDARKTDFENDKNADIVVSPKGKLTAQMMPPMKIVEEFAALSVNEVKPGTWVFDFGVNLVGNCKLNIPAGLPAGTELQLRHAETLTPDGNLYVANLRGAKCRDIYMASGKESLSQITTYAPTFTYHGFRYAELTGLPENIKPDKKSLTARAINTDLKKIGKFETNNKTINAIFQNVVRGTQGNYLSIPTDCPQRDERQGWQGDRAAESKGEMFIFDNITLYSKWLVDIEDSQRNDGNLSDVCPNYWQLYGSNVTWPSAFIIVPYNIYIMYGDDRPIKKHYEAMKRWLIGHLGQFVKDGIIDKDNYGDWCVPPEKPELIHSRDPKRRTAKVILATAYYIHCLDLLTKYAKLIGKNSEAEEFAQKSNMMKNAFNAKFLNKESAQYDNGTQTSCVLPLRFEIVPEESKAKVFDTLVNNIENITNNHIGTGLIGGQWLNRVLTDFGRGDIAYKFTTHEDYPSWGYMVKKGATTIWELWNGDTANPAMNSGNHVMLVGDLVIWYYEYLAGIKPDPEKPGFEHIVMKPHLFDGLQYVNAEYNSIKGTIISNWKKTNNKFHWEIYLPPSTTADIHLPNGKIIKNVHSGKHTFDITIDLFSNLKIHQRNKKPTTKNHL